MNEIFTLLAEFDNRDDALAAVELLRELGIAARIKGRRINTKRQPVQDWRISRILLAAMDPGRTYDLETLITVGHEHHFSSGSVSPVLSALCNAGVLERVDRGLFKKKG